MRLEELLRRGARDHGERTAITHWHDGAYQQLSYAELNDKAESLALNILDYLASTPHRDTPFCGIFIPRNAGQVVAILAILMAGAAYVPLALDATISHLRTVHDQTEMRLIITESSQRACLEDLLSQAGCQGVVQIIDVAEADTPKIKSLGKRHLSPSDPAYVLFSSGTTGTPKGIIISHSAVHTYCEGINPAYKATKDDKWVRAAVYTFDASIDEMFCPLSIGAEMVIQPGGALASFPSYMQFLRDTSATIVTMTTALWHTFADYVIREEQSLPPELRIIPIGGEAGHTSILKAWQARFGPHPIILNRYGPTETTVCATVWEANPNISVPIMPLGRPLAGYECYVLDPTTNIPMNCGDEGVMFISGPALALGYLGRSKLTEQRFVTNPWARSSEYQRMYNTGDLVYVDHDGIYHFRGRADLQVKIRGFRVDLAVIESCLWAHPSVAETAVISMPDQWTHSLKAFIVEARDKIGSIYVDELIDHCRKTLAPYEVPAQFVKVDKLPYNASRKVDRKVLALLPAERLPFTRDPTPSLDPGHIDSVLAKLWQGCLTDVPASSLHGGSNFIDLGGNSLISITLAAKIRSATGRCITSLEILQNPSLSQMSQLLEEGPDSCNTQLPPNIVALQRRASVTIDQPKAMLFLFHFIGGDLETLPSHVNQLDNENLGIVTYGVIWEPGRHLNSYDKMAQSYAQSICALAGSLPCFLIGWCYGGLTAALVSQRLPQTTTHVILLDAPHPAEMGVFDIETYFPKELAAQTLGRFSKHEEKLIQALHKIRPNWHDIPALITIIRAHGVLRPAVTDEDLRQRLEPFPDNLDVCMGLRDIARDFESERNDLQARVLLHLQAVEGMDKYITGLPAGLGWERYEIVENSTHDTIGFMPATWARVLAVIREVLSK